MSNDLAKFKASMEVGPHGGRFYLNRHGEKVYGEVETSPVPRQQIGNKRLAGAGAGAQLPDALKGRLKTLGVKSLPAAHIAEIAVSNFINHPTKKDEGALLKWKDDSGKVQSAYSAEFHRRNAVKKWARTKANAPRVEAALKDLNSKAQTDPASASALLMTHTALRPGSPKSVRELDHYGATTLRAKHVTFKGDRVNIAFAGKAGKINYASSNDPSLVRAMRAHARGKAPDALVFSVPKARVAASLPKGVMIKDLRTIVATKTARSAIGDFTPKLNGTPAQNKREVSRILKTVSQIVAEKLNNTPLMARKSYIHPEVIQEWGRKHKVPKGLIKWP